MYCTAIVATLAAWFVGLVLDVNLDVGDPMGFLCLRILLPMLTLGLLILHSIHKRDQNSDEPEK